MSTSTTPTKGTSSLAATVAATTAATAASAAAAEAAKSKKPYETPRAVKIFDGVLDTIIVAIVMFMLAYSAFAMWDTDNMHNTAMSDQYSIYNPAENPLTFEELRAINPDVFGWITVFGTLIDYPLVQGTNNSHYLNHNAKGEWSLAGAIFLDVENDRNFTDFNHIIHGHHMDQGAMFGNIDLFVDPDFFESRKYGNLFFNDRDHGLEFFAFIETSGYNWQVFNPAVTGRENQVAYLDMLYEIATHSRDIGVTADDRIALLATCTNEFTNGRHLLVAKIHDTPFPNPFAEGDAELRERTNFIDGEFLPFLRTICFPALLIAIILVSTYWAIQKRKRWNVEDKWTLIEANPELLAKLEKEGLGPKKGLSKKDKKSSKKTAPSKTSP
ncbi:MAG: class B sortase [Coriobacteriia bacterium]|nr:class B sortase [Coriobacteriia bacterium]MCL2746281.1 class B sortase [Coriobacteriia bacterium]MCL2871246.1 class B sortase [Coriobacteriia bacterium]